MKIYLLNPPYLPNFGRGARWQEIGRAGTLYYPIWLAYATANLGKSHTVRLIDAVAKKWTNIDVLNDVKSFKPDLIVIDSSFPSLNNDMQVASYLKENYLEPIKIVLVGPPTSRYSEKILSNTGADITARLEYDFTLLALADILEDSESLECLLNVDGISFRYNDKILHNPNRPLSTSKDLDDIPFVSEVYDKHLNIENYFLGQSLYPEVQILTGRGCPNQCTFCSWPQTLTGRKYRVRSIPNVIDELEWIENNLRIKEVFFEDDTFTTSKTRVLEFCREYKERKLSIVWSCNARVDSLNLETMKEMRKSNCRLLIAGYESGNDSILKSVKKGITVNDIRSFARSAKKAKLMVHGDFIIGLPGENQNTIENTKSLIKEIKPEILQVAVASPFPGTEFYHWCDQNGYLTTNDPNEYLDESGHQKAIVSYPWLSTEDIASAVDDMLRNYYLSADYIPVALQQIFRQNGLDEAKRILYSAKQFINYVKNR